MHENKSKIVTDSSLPKHWEWLLHVVGWGIFLLFPFFSSGRYSETITWSDYMHFSVNFIPVVIVFYANYLYLVKRFLFTRQIWNFVFANLLLFTTLAIVTHLIMDQVPPPSGMDHRRPPKPDSKYWFILFDYIKFTFATVFSIALKMTKSWYKTEAARKELEQSRSEAELQNLKSQLNPHFLFNTLNNIYSLIAISTDRAQEAVLELSRMLRYVLYESNAKYVTIGKDLDFVHNYIELMRIRLPQNVEVKTEINTSSPETLIAPLLFIAPIENAFKHGVSNNNPSFIHIEINAGSESATCTIRNSYFPKNEQDKSGSGIGLINLRKRLNLLYPGKHIFSYRQDNEEYYCFLEAKFD